MIGVIYRFYKLASVFTVCPCYLTSIHDVYFIWACLKKGPETYRVVWHSQIGMTSALRLTCYTTTKNCALYADLYADSNIRELIMSSLHIHWIHMMTIWPFVHKSLKQKNALRCENLSISRTAYSWLLNYWKLMHNPVSTVLNYYLVCHYYIRVYINFQ